LLHKKDLPQLGRLSMKISTNHLFDLDIAAPPKTTEESPYERLPGASV
jgi:hypothetical protein